MNCRKTTITLKRHGFCGQVKQMVNCFLYYVEPADLATDFPNISTTGFMACDSFS